MPRIGVITLGLDPKEEYLDNFLFSLEKTLDETYWDKEKPIFDYKELNPTKIANSCDTLVFSPGLARVGLPDYKRAERDPNVLVLYNLIHAAVQEGIPLLGINAGHEALNCTYGNAIDEVPVDVFRKNYHNEQGLDVSEMKDPIFDSIEKITFKLTNDYWVLPKNKQRKRWGQSRVEQLAEFTGGILVSKIKSEAPVYGVQFNIQPGTEAVFRNFFRLAKQYLER